MCENCGKEIQRDSETQEKRFCSKDCRKERKAFDREAERIKTLNPLAGMENYQIRAWHAAFGKMCWVLAIDWTVPGGKVYLKTNDTDYEFACAMNDLVLMMNHHRVADNNPIEPRIIFEGDVCSFRDVDEKSKTGTVASDQPTASLVLRVKEMNGEEEITRVFPLTAENIKNMNVLVIGDMYRAQQAFTADAAPVAAEPVPVPETTPEIKSLLDEAPAVEAQVENEVA